MVADYKNLLWLTKRGKKRRNNNAKDTSTFYFTVDYTLF